MKIASGDVVRAAEWQRVRDFAAGARARPTALVIAGEAGAGKSTLWRGGVAAACDARCRVLRSEPSAAETDMPFAGLSDLLTDALPQVAGEIPVPQREALETALLLRPAGDSPPTARAVGSAVLAALRGVAAEGPVLLAIDDVHWLDNASLDAITFAFRRADSESIGLLLAARTEAPADPVTVALPPPSRRWRDLAAAVPAEIIDLGPLDARQLRRVLPASVSATQARLAAKQSRGNPFWAQEIAASIESIDSPVPVLARTLTKRLAASLSAEAAEALGVVAACGRPTARGVLRVLDHLDDPVAALDEAVLAGFITASDGRGTVAHPLSGMAAIELLPPGRRRQMYQHLSLAVDGPEMRAHFAALAAGSGPDADVAAALDAATEAAHSRAGYAEAARFAGLAARFTPARNVGALTQRQIRAAELLFLAGDVHRCLEQAEEVDLRQLATADLERLLPLLLDVNDVIRGAPASAAIVAELARDIGSADPRRRALVLALASDFDFGIRGRRGEAAIESIRSAELAGPAAGPSLHRALLNLADAKVSAGDGLDHELLDRAEQLEADVRLDRLHESAELCRGLWSLDIGDLDTARTSLRRCIDRARDAGHDFTLAGFWTYLAAVEAQAGDYRAAREALAAADSAGAWHDWPRVASRFEPGCDVLIADGDLDAALGLAARQLPDTGEQAPVRRFVGGLVRGRISAWRADTADAIRWFERAAESADECEFADPGVRQGLDAMLAEAYVAQGRVDDGRRISAWLRLIGESQDRPALIGYACRIDALAAAVDGGQDVAADHARDAVAAHESTPLRPELARSLLILGQIERRRRVRRESRRALRRGHELALEMGHQPLLRLIEQELSRVAAVRSGAELTATERRVAELIAAGATNQEAATALFVSVRTIETHVASIYRKLGVRSRAEFGRRYAPGAVGPPAP